MISWRRTSILIRRTRTAKKVSVNERRGGWDLTHAAHSGTDHVSGGLLAPAPAGGGPSALRCSGRLGRAALAQADALSQF